jgi:hypothetical protein
MLQAVWNYLRVSGIVILPAKRSWRSASGGTSIAGGWLGEEKTLAQLPPMAASCVSFLNESETASIQEIQDETHYRTCGFLDTL